MIQSALVNRLTAFGDLVLHPILDHLLDAGDDKSPALPHSVQIPLASSPLLRYSRLRLRRLLHRWQLLCP